MAAPATAEAFLDVVRKSNQIDTGRLDAYLSGRSTGPSIDPRRLAAQLVRAGVITLFQAEQFLLGKHKGFVLGGYRIIERLGTGGTGTVYLGEHTVMRRRVAIKVLPTPLAADPAIRERFRREAQAAGMLDHPNVVHVFDFREENGLHAIIMEYVQGPNLQQLINKRGPQPIPEACEYVRQAAVGLQHAHDKGMVHRDIKPANLVLDMSGLIKILDLGLARCEIEGESSVTQRFNNKMVMGTADFLPPEQAMSLHDVDHRADIYALGATLYALIAGRPPFHEGSIGQKLLWHQARVPDRLDAVRPDVPKALADLVARMLEKKPDDRPGSCADVAVALEQWAGIGEARVNVQPSPAMMAEFSLASPSIVLSCTTPSRMLPSMPPAPDTLGSQAKEETGKIASRTPAPPTRKAEPAVNTHAPTHGPSNARLIVFGFLGAVVAGLIGAVTAVLMLGPR